MSALSAVEAFEILKFAQQYLPRLEDAHALLEKREASELERGWSTQAIALVSAELRGAPAVLERARPLPELAELVARLADEDQGRWVDALERLVAGITFTAGSRSPLIEALFPHQKWPALRRAVRDEVARFQAEFERRSKTGYVTRLLAADELTVVRPVFEQVAQAFARWQACFSPAPLSSDEAETLRTELRAAAERMDRVIRQARLLTEAALLIAEGSFEQLGLNAKPRKRAAKVEVPAEVPAGEVHATAEELVAQEAEDAASAVEAERPAARRTKRKGAAQEAGAEAHDLEPATAETSPPSPDPSAQAEAPPPRAKRSRKKGQVAEGATLATETPAAIGEAASAPDHAAATEAPASPPDEAAATEA